MKYDAEIDEEILQNVLYRTGTSAESLADSDEADELFALLIEKGELEDDDRKQFLRCLDASSTARMAVSRYMQRVANNPELSQLPDVVMADPCASPSALSRFRQWTAERLKSVRELAGSLPGTTKSTSLQTWQRQSASVGGRSTSWAFPFVPSMAMACATLLLLATAEVLWVGWQPASGVPLLAMRGGPNLMDYGFNFNAIGTKGDDAPPRIDIKPLLATIPIVDRKHIESGFAFLQKNNFSDAQDAFGQPLATPVGRYYGQLGTAMALYMQHQYSAAESAFQRAIDSGHESTAAKVGRAMALTRLEGREREAMKLLQEVVDDEHLPKEQRVAIADQIKRFSQTKTN